MSIFVSYVREDKSIVEPLVYELRRLGFPVWWDTDIPPEAPWEITIEQQLDAARTVIVCWSSTSVLSENVKAEARRAKKANKLIQVFIDQCEPPLFFGERQGFDITDPRNVGRLTQHLRQMASDDFIARRTKGEAPAFTEHQIVNFGALNTPSLTMPALNAQTIGVVTYQTGAAEQGHASINLLREILSFLKRDELHAICNTLRIEPTNWRDKALIADSIAESGNSVDVILAALTNAMLSDVLYGLGKRSTGLSKKQMVDSILEEFKNS